MSTAEATKFAENLRDAIAQLPGAHFQAIAQGVRRIGEQREQEQQESAVKFKRTSAYADQLWSQRPRADQWPDVLDLYEAAAYLRVDYKSIWRACQVARTDRKARLAHQRIGSAYRIRRTALDNLGHVAAREVAA